MLAEFLKSTLPDPLLQPLRRAWWRVHIAKDWFGSTVWTNTREVMTPLGFKLAAGFHPAYSQMRNGTFEVGETAALSRLLAKADLFVDVGANLGYYTLLAAKMGVPVIAVEPQPLNLRTLHHNLSVNGWSDRVEVHPLALSFEAGCMSLFGASGPSASLLPGWAKYSARHSQIVDVSTLDAVLAGTAAGKRLVIKIDVEGAEHMVLGGASATLARSPRPSWLIEVCSNEFHPSGFNPYFADTFAMFFDAGYRAFTAEAEPVEVTPADVARWVAQGHAGPVFNYVFTT
jgi:FkbM family methyltransferase